jgi:23S rRNA pseudouridine955/2504/2580 synthase
MIELKAGKDDTGRRIDRILRKALPDYSLSLIHRLLRQKKILVDNKPISPNYHIEQGMVIKIYIPATNKNNPVNKINVNHKISMVNKKNLQKTLPPILWKGSGIIIFNKPQGISTHGPASLDTIVNAWLSCGGGSPLPRSLSFRPGPLHRLDKLTSGAIAFSQTLEGARLFSLLLRERRLEKSYIAIVEGSINGEESWQDGLTHDTNAYKTFVTHPGETARRAKEAVTAVTTIVSNGGYSLIEARIKTGRHHQIRAQAASHGHPLAGDLKYGARTLPDNARRSSCFWLHAWKIICNACPDGFPREIIAPLPEAFQSKITELFGRRGLGNVIKTG